MLYVDQAVEQFRKRLASTIAAKDGHVEQLEHSVQHDHPSLQWSRLIVHCRNYSTSA